MGENTVFGIDLGTTYSSICLYSSNRPDIIADKYSKIYIPSIVYLSKKKGEKETIIYGNFAQKKQLNNPKMSAFDLKRMLGHKYKDDSIQSMLDKWPFKIEEDEEGDILICFPDVEKKYKPYELSGEFLKLLVEQGNTRLQEEKRTNNAVITIPANFNDIQRHETIKAAEYAGLNVLTIINEPTAAGIAFGLQNRNEKPHNVIIFDFGGGTLDISLMYVDQKEVKVIGTDGNMHLGGRDFDEKIVEFLVKKLNLSENFTKSAKKMSKLREQVVDAKIELSNSDSSTIVLDDEDLEYEMSLEEFEEINKDLIDRIIIPVEKLLRDKNIDKSEIHEIIKVGGSSNMKFVDRKLEEFFGKKPYNGINPNDAVVTGAGIIAYEYANNWDSSKIKNVIDYIEICSFSIGTSTYGESMECIIEKGTEIPVERGKRFGTVLYRQESLQINIYEGEHSNVKNNHFLACIQIDNIPISEGVVFFSIIFKVDKNGILSASVQLEGYDIQHSQNIKIQKIRSKAISNIIDDDVDLETIRLKVFYQNIQRFISFNYKELNSFYPDHYLQIDTETYLLSNKLPDLTTLAEIFVNKFYKYLMHKGIPDFFFMDP